MLSTCKFKYCDECQECTNDLYHEYCVEHNNKYIVTDNFYNKRICDQCIINPNKKTRYCSECEIRHNLKFTDVCKICNTCMERDNIKYKHCDKCNNCYQHVNLNNDKLNCNSCTHLYNDSDLDSGSESDNLLDMIRIPLIYTINNSSHNLIRSNSNYSNETEYSQLNLSDIDFNNSSSEEEV